MTDRLKRRRQGTNESYRSALQAFIDRRRFSETSLRTLASPSSPDKRSSERYSKNNNNKKDENDWKSRETVCAIPGVPHIRASEIFEIGWVAGTEDRYLELIFAEWQSTRVALKRHTHPDCQDAVKADLEVLTEIRHPNVLLLMATTQTEDHGLISIFESIDCTLYNYVHEQGERISLQGIARSAGKLADALRHSHMRGYIHGAISSHCVYLASSGAMKLGGWELANNIKNMPMRCTILYLPRNALPPIPEREYEERLRTEIFKWQAPELFCGCEPRKESDIYGLALLIWEMCTMHVPWSGFSKPDVERQYLQWKRGVIMDLYDFPPLLHNLLEAGLQLDVSKRNIDMNRMRRFLQRLEMQYEDEEPVYVNQYTSNNNEPPNSPATPIPRSPNVALKSKTPAKTPVKQLFCPPKEDLASKQFCNTEKVASMQQANVFNIKEEDKNKSTENPADKNTNMFSPMKKNDVNSLNNKLENCSIFRNMEGGLHEAPRPWNSTYRKVKPYKEAVEADQDTYTVTSNSSRLLESTDDDESLHDARTTIKRLKEILASRRERFFYGNDILDVPKTDTSPKTKNRILTQIKSKDYEPHKPASHKTSLEPKFSKSPGEYDPSYANVTCTQCQKPYSHTIAVLNADPQTFFESSLWKKEKLICLSKMRRTVDNDESTFIIAQDSTTASDNQTYSQIELPTTDETYVVKHDSTVKSGTSSQANAATVHSEDTFNSNDNMDLHNEPLQDLKNALDRATEIIRSTPPESDKSRVSNYGRLASIEVSLDDAQVCKSIFEDIYKLNDNNDNEEIKSIEKSASGNETFHLNIDRLNDVLSQNKLSDDSAGKIKRKEPSVEANYPRNFTCESITEMSNESNASHSDTKSERKIEADSNKKVLNAKNIAAHSGQNKSHEANINERESARTNFPFVLLNEPKDKGCKTCHHKNGLPRRRSLPAALGQLQSSNNPTLGKLPIRKGDVSDNTVEDIYIDDEFGDGLNVNMLLINEDISLDEDFLPEISEL